MFLLDVLIFLWKLIHLFIQPFNNFEYTLGFHALRRFLMIDPTGTTWLSQGISEKGNSEHLTLVQEDIPYLLGVDCWQDLCPLSGISYRWQWPESPGLLKSRMLTTTCQHTSVRNPLALVKLISLISFLKWCMFHASLFWQ